MSILLNADRADCIADYMRTFSQTETVGISKTDLRAALNAIDVWVDDNAANFNSAIPQPARSTLTTPQKARLLLWVVMWRYRIGV